MLASHQTTNVAVYDDQPLQGRTSEVPDKFLLSAIAVVVVIAVIIAIAERRDLCAQPRDGEVPDLERPAGIDRGLRAGKGQVEREIRSVDEFSVKAESWARREKQTAGRALGGNAV